MNFALKSAKINPRKDKGKVKERILSLRNHPLDDKRTPIPYEDWALLSLYKRTKPRRV